MFFIFLLNFFIYNYYKKINWQSLVPTVVTLFSCISSHSHSSKEKFSKFDTQQSKTGDKVSSNIGNSVTLINNSPANTLLLISDEMKKLLGNKKDIRRFCSLKNTSNADKLSLWKISLFPVNILAFQRKVIKSDSPSHYNWLELFPWLSYFFYWRWGILYVLFDLMVVHLVGIYS